MIVCEMSIDVLHSNVCDTQLIYKKDMTHVHDCVQDVNWMSHITHTNESRHTYERVPSHIRTSHIAQQRAICVCTSRVTHMNEVCHTYAWVTSHVWMSHVTHAYTYRALTYDGTGWDSLWETARVSVAIFCVAVCCRTLYERLHEKP